MSRGLGHIERTILRMVNRQRRNHQMVRFNAKDILFEAYDGKDWDSHAHYVATVRAMHSFVRKYPRYVLAGWGEEANTLYLVPALRFEGESSGNSKQTAAV